MVAKAASGGIVSQFDLTGQIALVTGAARGLGNACALALAQAGCDIALGLRDKSTGKELADSIRSLGRRVLPLQMDVTRLSEITSAVAEAVDHFGRIDILVNNAGFGRGAPAEDMTEEAYDVVVAANLKGLFFTTARSGAGHDQEPQRQDHQPRIAGRDRRAPWSVGLLHDQGRRFAPHQVPCGRVGQAQHQRQLRRAHLHPNAGHDGLGTR